MISLGERLSEYESIFDISIMKRVPIIVRLNIRNYKKILPNIKKPFSKVFSDIMHQCTLYIISQIQDAVFGYSFNDEINIILRNDRDLDTEPWNNNNLQKIISSVTSYAINGFEKSVELFSDLDIVADCVVNTKVWPISNISESGNYLISRQDSCIKQAINTACGFELKTKFGADKATAFIKNKTYEQKKEILLRYCGIDFFDFYESRFVHGCAVYKVPVIVDGITKNKWFADEEIPNFLTNKDFIVAIISNGSDIFRSHDIGAIR